MSEEKNNLNNLLIPTAITAAVAYFAGNKKTEKMAEAAKELITKAIDDYTGKARQKVIDVTPQKQLPHVIKYKGYPKTKIKNANKNH